MSPTARRRLFRPFRRACIECRVQPALFQYRGRVRADRDHTLCFRCFRSEVQRQRARRLGAPAFRFLQRPLSLADSAAVALSRDDPHPSELLSSVSRAHARSDVQKCTTLPSLPCSD